ncbi:hypothetical protein WJX82_009521 [Trebouxia sp. C0006]
MGGVTVMVVTAIVMLMSVAVWICQGNSCNIYVMGFPSSSQSSTCGLVFGPPGDAHSQPCMTQVQLDCTE